MYINNAKTLMMTHEIQGEKIPKTHHLLMYLFQCCYIYDCNISSWNYLLINQWYRIELPPQFLERQILCVRKHSACHIVFTLLVLHLLPTHGSNLEQKIILTKIISCLNQVVDQVLSLLELKNPLSLSHVSSFYALKQNNYTINANRFSPQTVSTREENHMT